MNHCMIDLETLGTKVSSVFLSIAAVQFDIGTGKIGEKFLANIEMDSALRAGLTVDAPTIKWWMEQDKVIRDKMFQYPIGLKETLILLSEWVHDNNIVYPWANSARFDLGILDYAYNNQQIDLPWSFRNERCYRTYVNLFPEITQSLPKPSGVHDPMVDCFYQIEKLCYAHGVVTRAVANAV